MVNTVFFLFLISISIEQYEAHANIKISLQTNHEKHKIHNKTKNTKTQDRNLLYDMAYSFYHCLLCLYWPALYVLDPAAL